MRRSAFAVRLKTTQAGRRAKCWLHTKAQGFCKAAYRMVIALTSITSKKISILLNQHSSHRLFPSGSSKNGETSAPVALARRGVRVLL